MTVFSVTYFTVIFLLLTLLLSFSYLLYYCLSLTYFTIGFMKQFSLTRSDDRDRMATLTLHNPQVLFNIGYDISIPTYKINS